MSCGNKRSCVCNKPALKRFQHFHASLQRIARANNKELQDIIQTASPCLLRFISELCLNILKGNLQLRTHQYKKLRPHKRSMINLSRIGLNPQVRREVLLKKKGGFLPALVPILLSALAGFAGETLGKAVG